MDRHLLEGGRGLERGTGISGERESKETFAAPVGPSGPHGMIAELSRVFGVAPWCF